MTVFASGTALTNPNELRRELLGSVFEADKRFDLGIGREQRGVISKALSVHRQLGFECFGTLKDLRISAIDLQGEESSGYAAMHARDVRCFQALGLGSVADAWAAFAQFASCVPLYAGEPESGWEGSDLVDPSQAERQLKRLSLQLAEARRADGIERMDSGQVFAKVTGVETCGDADFDRYWVMRCVQSAGFARCSERDEREEAHLGWLRPEHLTALARHGYNVLFTFWERPSGHSRGWLWLQTDKGPLRLFDRTDAATSRAMFPIDVATVDNHQLFELTEEDTRDPPSGGWRKWFRR